MSPTLKNTLFAFLLLVCNRECWSGVASTQDIKSEIETDLVLVHVLARHGARTTYHFYPTDPHINDSFFPMGHGGLRNDGKLSGFKLGERLRKEYNSFLGEMYTDELIKARSTDVYRTRMTAQVILAGLFPPVDTQRWNDKLDWIPIPVFVTPAEHEEMFNPTCPYKMERVKNMVNDQEIHKKFVEPYHDLFNFVSKHAGYEIRNLLELIEFYFVVSTEAEMGLKLPKWVHDVYPEPIYSAVSNVYAFLNADKEVKQINIGYLLKNILNDTVAKTKGQLRPRSRKMFLYAGHESTLGWMMDHLNVLKPQIPPYSSAFIIELRKDKNYNHYIKLRYLIEPQQPFEELKMPNCDLLCPLKKFIAMNEDFLPTVSFREACNKSLDSAHASLYISGGSLTRMSMPFAILLLVLSILNQ